MVSNETLDVCKQKGEKTMSEGNQQPDVDKKDKRSHGEILQSILTNDPKSKKKDGPLNEMEITEGK